jgi:Holliday junction resolvase-like predicted endonuclease
VAIAAVVDESGLQRRLYASDFGEIDIPAQRSLTCGFEVKFLDAIPSQDHHPGFFRV